MANRVKFIIAIFFLIYAGILARLYYLQILKNNYYLARAQLQYENTVFEKGLRGSIYFRDKNNDLILAATNKNFPIIYAVPSEIKDASETIFHLKEFINFSSQKLEDLKKFLSNKKSQYALILRKAPEEVVSKIKELNISGIYINNLPERYYPFNNLASHVLGYVGEDENDIGESGKYGIEKKYDDKLKGESGKIQDNKIFNSKSGEDIILTIDPNIQREAERILSSLVVNQKAKSGLFIVQEPKTGKILAMGAVPNFDPNNYSKYDVSNFLNPAISKVYEPGSIFKVITMASGIDAKKFTPETEVFDSGSLILNGKKIQNWDKKSHGKVTMTQVIENSINVGAAQAQMKIGREIFLNYLKKFGFNTLTGIDLPGEVVGSLKSLLDPKAPDINYATASFGQGVSVTPIELITAIGAIANGGNLMRPYLNAANEPQVITRVISTSTAEAVTQMMVSAVDKAKVAKIKGYSIAGKTGTAQVPDLKNGGYKESYIHTYVGFGPTKDPRFIILIRIDEPEGAQLAGLTVVPAFRELAQFILNYYNIPPDRIEN